MKNKFSIVKICFIFLWFTFNQTDSKWTKYCNIKAFNKTHGVYSYNQWNYFQRRCMDKRRSGDFSIQTWCIPFASKNLFIYLAWTSCCCNILDIDECTDVLSSCPSDKQCTNTVGSFFCHIKCRQGYKPSDNGLTCIGEKYLTPILLEPKVFN